MKYPDTSILVGIQGIILIAFGSNKDLSNSELSCGRSSKLFNPGNKPKKALLGESPMALSFFYTLCHIVGLITYML